MKNNVEKFLSEVFGEVRAIKENDNIWFVAKDICIALEYSESNVSSVVSRLDDDQKTTLTLTTSGNYTTNVLCVNEDGVYDIVTGASRKPKAKPFRKWITKEVIPTIRKTGGFVDDNQEETFINNYFPSFSEEVKLAMVQDLRKQNAILKPKAEKFDKFLDSNKTYSFTDVAKLISTKATEEGLNIKISNQKLTELLREKSILTKDKTKKGYKNNPRKEYEEYFNVVVAYNRDGEILNKTQTRVKSNGVEFIYNVVKKNFDTMTN